MKQKPKYKTKQQDILLEYLKTIPGVHITANELCSCFEKQDASISKATVYRKLEELVDEGIVNKYIIDGNSPACFEYIEENSHQNAEICFHCKCEKCNKLIHLHCEELEDIQAHLLAEHKFQLNPMRTVFYGLCKDCMKHSEAS